MAYRNKSDEKKYHLKYREKNKDRIREYHKKYYEENIDKFKRRGRERYIKNKDILCKNARKYKLKNKKRIREVDKKYYQKNREKILGKRRVEYKTNKTNITQEQRKYNKNYHNNRYNNDIQYRLRVRMCNRFNNAVKKYSKDDKLPVSRNKNIDYNAIFEHLKPFPNDMSKYHIDHIIPLDFFDLTNNEQIRRAWNPINFQWLMCRDNSQKRDIIDFDKYPKQVVVFNKLGLVHTKPKGL